MKTVIRWAVTAVRFVAWWLLWWRRPSSAAELAPPQSQPLALNVGLTRSPIGTMAVRPLSQVQQIIDANGPAWNPYDYWRELWLRDGDMEALRQMERFVQ